MRLDGIEPTGIRRRRHQADVVVVSELREGVMPMRRQVVLNQVQAHGGGVAHPQPLPGGQQIAADFALVNRSGQTVAMDVVEGQQLLGPLGTSIRRAQALRMPDRRPAGPGHGLEFHRTEFVEADDRALGRGLLVELQDPIFLTQSADRESPSRFWSAGS